MVFCGLMVPQSLEQKPPLASMTDAGRELRELCGYVWITADECGTALICWVLFIHGRAPSAYLPVRKPRDQPEVSVMDE